MPVGSIVSKVHIYYFKPTSYLYGIVFFDSANKLLLTAGDSDPDPEYLAVHEIILRDGDKLIGAKSRMKDPSESAECYDFRFVVARMH
jgi:hypothetical protein